VESNNDREGIMVEEDTSEGEEGTIEDEGRVVFKDPEPTILGCWKFHKRMIILFFLIAIAASFLTGYPDGGIMAALRQFIILISLITLFLVSNEKQFGHLTLGKEGIEISRIRASFVAYSKIESAKISPRDDIGTMCRGKCTNVLITHRDADSPSLKRTNIAVKEIDRMLLEFQNVFRGNFKNIVSEWDQSSHETSIGMVFMSVLGISLVTGCLVFVVSPLAGIMIMFMGTMGGVIISSVQYYKEKSVVKEEQQRRKMNLLKDLTTVTDEKPHERTDESQIDPAPSEDRSPPPTSE